MPGRTGLLVCRHRFTFASIACVLIAAPLAAQQQIENVAAFARLYGVARWFYPSDAAAGLDWNRFAVEGVRRVRDAQTPSALERALGELFAPLGPGITIGTTLPPAPRTSGLDTSLVAWHYRGAGIADNPTSAYSAKRMNRVTGTRAPVATTGVLMQNVPAETLRGKTIRLRGKVRVPNQDATGWAGLWLRVDRTAQTVGFFDNMQDRPVRDSAWRDYVIEGPVALDATRISFGVIAAGATTTDVDDLELSVRDAAGEWTPVVIRDPSFESQQTMWSQSGAAQFLRRTDGAAHGARYARIIPQPSAPGAPGAIAIPSDALKTPVVGASVDIDLARGLRARVRLSLTDAEARTAGAGFAELRTALTQVAQPAGRSELDVRLADIVVSWNVFRHFYPYWPDLGLDWDARLRPQLSFAFEAAETREAHHDAVRALVADLRDGHGGAYDIASRPLTAQLPVQFRILENQLVVTASAEPAIPVGSLVITLGGTPSSLQMLRETQLASGTTQWKETRAAGALQTCRANSTVAMTIETPRGDVRDVQLLCDRAMVRAYEARPDSITELRPGIWYVDLTRIRRAQLLPMMQTLAEARGVIFDVRGYPTDAGYAVLPHLMRAPEDSTDRWMHVPRYARPFAEVAAWQDISWNLQPAVPHIAGNRVFLTDGRAISYAESVMGYVRDYKLGTIIGAATAGANGNVASFMTPGGFSVSFTGMRVTRHDGRSRFHTDGVTPDIPLVPTLAGIRAGRDELLERALVTLRIQP